MRQGNCFYFPITSIAAVIVLGGMQALFVAGLIVEPGLDQVFAGRGHDARLNNELAGVDAELCLGIEGQRNVRAGRVDSRLRGARRSHREW